MKKSLVLGASLNEYRYSNMAIRSLVDHGEEVLALGLRNGKVVGIQIEIGFPKFLEIHTVTLYLNAKRQQQYYNYIISLQPKRVIFNPGAENFEFARILDNHNIYYENACTLVLLSTDQY
ncbi:MAG: CoA-binding protein [Bacteroidota bacterium]